MSDQTTPEAIAAIRTHELKTSPEYFAALFNGRKNFEYRRNDRGFQAGDTLRLREWDQEAGYSGRELSRRVTYVLSLGPWGDYEHVVMALADAELDTLAQRLAAAEQCLANNGHPVVPGEYLPSAMQRVVMALNGANGELCALRERLAAAEQVRDSRGYVLPPYVAVVAREGGGVQLEGHVKGQDWEIEVDDTGRLESFLCRPELPTEARR